MNIKSVLLVMVILASCVALAGDALADISNAAVLFLRIAPGSRAAGMGEAYVAVADDATATHWNPAGLGNYPLADTWIEAEIPAAYRPLKGFAPLSTGGTRNYLDYDIWAITSQGLIRYNNKRWNTEETFSTKTSETLEDIVRSYFRTADDARLAGVVGRVAALNNRGAYAELEALRDSILKAVPETYDARNSIVGDLDSLLASFSLCRVNWDRISEMRGQLKDGLKDSTLNDTECDRIAVSLERSRSRYLPEELRIPYSTLFESEPTSLASTGDILLVGTADGLVKFNGRRWEEVATAEGTPMSGTTCLYLISGSILVGSEDGINVFRGQTVSPLTSSESGLPDGRVEMVGGSSLVDLYAVVAGNLYHFDGRSWTDATSYTVAIDDSLDKIAARFSLYGTPADKQRFIDRYVILQATAPTPPAVDSTSGTDSTGAAIPVDSAQTTPQVVVDSTAPAMVADLVGTPGVDAPLQPGSVIRVPLAASIKGRVSSIFVDPQRHIWLGTDYGVFYFDDGRWLCQGNEEHVVVSGETLDSLVNRRFGHPKGSVVESKTAPKVETAIISDTVPALVGQVIDTATAVKPDSVQLVAQPMVDTTAIIDSNIAVITPTTIPTIEPAVMDERAAYRAQLLDMNDLSDATLVEGATIRIYSNPSGQAVNSIGGDGRVIYFATRNGLIEYDGRHWSRTSLRGLTRDNIVGVNLLGNESWIASDERLIIKGRGHSEASLMYVKWLPELADDLYYSFASFTTPKEGWGTFGGSFTLISYGTFSRMTDAGIAVGEFQSYDFAASISYGTSITNRLKGGLSFKVIRSQLSDVGAGTEKGSGSSTGYAIDVGVLYHFSSRLTGGAALTNLGPKMSYIDAAQSDDLPRNLAVGFSYKLLRSEYTSLIATVEANKLMVGLTGKTSKELKEAIFNGGFEFAYANLLAVRGGYIYDQEGEVKTFTVGFGLSPFAWGGVDFAYIPSQKDFSLANTLRISMRIIF
jgi:hypothetical protein